MSCRQASQTSGLPWIGFSAASAAVQGVQRAARDVAPGVVTCRAGVLNTFFVFHAKNSGAGSKSVCCGAWIGCPWNCSSPAVPRPPLIACWLKITRCSAGSTVNRSKSLWCSAHNDRPLGSMCGPPT